MNVHDDLLPPPILRTYLKKRLTLPTDVVTARTNEVPFSVYVSPKDAAQLRKWIDAMNAALRPGQEGGLSTLFSAVWIEDEKMAEGEIRVELEGRVL